MLDLSKLDADKMELNLVSVDLCELAGKALAEFAALAAQRQIQLCQRCDVDVAMIRCDVNRIHQVLANILGNAIKFTAEGSTIILHLGSRIPEAIDQAPTGYRLRVIDQGPGIPAEELGSIFDRFTQSSKTRTGAGGTGLGLPISREIMRLHGGYISASNHSDGGACFSIEFPVS